ncbi:hypothetical protein BaRGS_00038237 [Batillaria attramentaria]|uniref:Uncharacterized protein n=1 Tax=Batillaria attramentaria TaxID=370345 RepID=A0ABD0J6W4_9CAEN
MGMLPFLSSPELELVSIARPVCGKLALGGGFQHSRHEGGSRRGSDLPGDSCTICGRHILCVCTSSDVDRGIHFCVRSNLVMNT